MYYSFRELVKFKRLTVLSVGDSVEHLELSYHPSWKIEWHRNRSITNFTIHVLPEQQFHFSILLKRKTNNCVYEKMNG